MHGLRILPILFSALLICACSESQPESAGEILESLNPCELLTAEDIQQVTGHAMKPGDESHEAFCSFESVEVNEVTEMPKYNWFLYHMRKSVASPQEIEKYQNEKMASVGEEYESTPVSGVGDQAYWERYFGVTQLTVYKSDGRYTHTVSVQPNFKGEEQMLEQAKTLARKALARL
jgi:hypothetical protein